MKPFDCFTGIAAPFDEVDVDTDQIIPTRFLLEARSDGNYGRRLFHDLRYDESGAERPGFVLNQGPFRQAEVLVANDNFGCGSSREQAAWACADFGFRAIVAPSLGDIFKANCAKLGIVPAIMSAAALQRLRDALRGSPGEAVTVDLVNNVVTGPGNWNEVLLIEDCFRHRLLHGCDDFDLSHRHHAAIEEFRKTYSSNFPWADPAWNRANPDNAPGL